MIACKICMKDFGTGKTLIRHEMEKHQLPKHSCEVCGGRFKRLEYLKRHASSKKCRPDSFGNHSGERMGNTVSRSDGLTIPTATGNCTRMNHYEHEQARPERLHEQNRVALHEKENTEWKQIGRGHHQKPDSMETDSNEDVETEVEADQEDDDNSVDVFDRDSDSSSENSSSEDSDDCESSSDNSSGDEDSDEDENAIPTEEAAWDGSVETVPDADDENEGSQQPQPKYVNFARWRNSDRGIYTAWSSQSKKPHVVQHREWLKKILKTPDKLMKPLIMDASDSQLEAFREIAANVLKGYAAMRPQLFNIVRKNKHDIRILASEDSSYDQLRRTLLSTREFLAPILVFFATPTCIKSEKAALDKLPAE